jgi:hypothetical protein
MPKWLKGLLILGGIGFALVLAISFAAGLWFKNNKERLVEEGKASKNNGVEFGRAHDKDACVTEALRRGAECGAADFVCEAKQKLFMVSCLGESPKDPEFCRGAPKMGEIMATATYLNDACEKRGQPGSQRCTRLLQAIPEHCAGRR